PHHWQTRSSLAPERMIGGPNSALNATGGTRSRESAPVCAPANGYMASRLHIAVGEFLRYRDNKLFFEDEPGQRLAAKLLTKDEARRIASNIRQAAGAIGQSLMRGGSLPPLGSLLAGAKI